MRGMRVGKKSQIKRDGEIMVSMIITVWSVKPKFEMFTIYNDIFNFAILEYSKKLCLLIDKPSVSFIF